MGGKLHFKLRENALQAALGKKTRFCRAHFRVSIATNISDLSSKSVTFCASHFDEILDFHM